MSRQTQVLILLLCIMATLVLVRSVQQIDLYFYSMEYDEIQVELGSVKRSNLLLSETLLSKESLLYLEPEAKKRGFVQATYYYYR